MRSRANCDSGGTAAAAATERNATATASLEPNAATAENALTELSETDLRRVADRISQMLGTSAGGGARRPHVHRRLRLLQKLRGAQSRAGPQLHQPGRRSHHAPRRGRGGSQGHRQIHRPHAAAARRHVRPGHQALQRGPGVRLRLGVHQSVLRPPLRGAAARLVGEGLHGDRLPVGGERARRPKPWKPGGRFARARPKSTWSSTSAHSRAAAMIWSTAISAPWSKRRWMAARSAKSSWKPRCLNDDEKTRACQAARRARADFVKTSTGFGPGGATADDVALMSRAVSGTKMGVKASGGIRNLRGRRTNDPRRRHAHRRQRGRADRQRIARRNVFRSRRRQILGQR